MLRLNPELVDMEKSDAEFPPFPEYTVNHRAGAYGVPLHRAGIGVLGDESGTWGDARQSTAESANGI